MIPKVLPLKNVSLTSILLISFLSLVYLAGSAWFIRYQTEQLILVLLFNSLYYFNKVTRSFILSFSIFIVYWIIFDSMKAFPNYMFAEVHLKDIYLTEKKWFGILQGSQMLTPNEYFGLHRTAFLDVSCGLFYLTWIPVPLLVAGYFFFNNRRQFFHFSIAFFLTNLLGFVVYYTFPAAPPWYVAQYGFELRLHTPGSAAGLGWFDDFYGINLFHAMYAKSSNVFAAMPSLHSAFPLITFFYAAKNKLGMVNILLFILMPGIWFSAVYTSHHYCLDVLAGITCAFAGIFLFEEVLLNVPLFRKLIDRYEAYVSK